MRVSKIVKAPHPYSPPQGGDLDLLASLDMMNGALGRWVPNRS